MVSMYKIYHIKITTSSTWQTSIGNSISPSYYKRHQIHAKCAPIYQHNVDNYKSNPITRKDTNKLRQQFKTCIEIFSLKV